MDQRGQMCIYIYSLTLVFKRMQKQQHSVLIVMSNPSTQILDFKQEPPERAKESTRQNCKSKELYWSTFNHSTQDIEAREALRVQGQPDLHRSSKTVRTYINRLGFKTNKFKNRKKGSTRAKRIILRKNKMAQWVKVLPPSLETYVQSSRAHMVEENNPVL